MQALGLTRQALLAYADQELTFQGEPSVVGLTTGPFTFALRITNTGRAYTGMDGMSRTMYLSSASFSILARCLASSVVDTALRTFVNFRLQ